MRRIAINRRKLVAASGIVAVLLVVGFGFRQASLAPNQGTITVGKTIISGASATAKANQSVVVRNQYAAFTYPSQFSAATLDPAQPPVLAQYAYIYHDSESWRLTITLTQIHGTGVADDSAYQLRKSQPDHYAQTTANFGGHPFTIMTDTQVGGFSAVAFTSSGTTAADISLIGDDPGGHKLVQAAFDSVLTSWQWQ